MASRVRSSLTYKQTDIYTKVYMLHGWGKKIKTCNPFSFYKTISLTGI